MKELIRLQQPNGSKRLWESEDLQNTNFRVAGCIIAIQQYSVVTHVATNTQGQTILIIY